jgi:hypothetical protein
MIDAFAITIASTIFVMLMFIISLVAYIKSGLTVWLKIAALDSILLCIEMYIFVSQF